MILKADRNGKENFFVIVVTLLQSLNIQLSGINKVSFAEVFSCSNSGSIRDDPN